jgi:hypothetical protein
MGLYLNIPPSRRDSAGDLYPKIKPLEYVSPWIVTSGVDYKAREE